MSDKVVSMVAETRPVAALLGGFEGGVFWRCADTRGCGGKHNCCRIVGYEENGQMAACPWFAVYGVNGEIIARVNAYYLEEVLYGD